MGLICGKGALARRERTGKQQDPKTTGWARAHVAAEGEQTQAELNGSKAD